MCVSAHDAHAPSAPSDNTAGGGAPRAGTKKGVNPKGLTPKTAATYSPTIRSTIGAGGLNFSVRNGKRWDPAAIAT